MNDFFTWSFLATFAGASTATAIITQLVKDALAKIPTQIVSYIIALVVLLVAMAATDGAEDWTGFAIVPFNAILVSLASNGTYVAITRITGGKEE